MAEHFMHVSSDVFSVDCGSYLLTDILSAAGHAEIHIDEDTNHTRIFFQRNRGK